MTPADEGRFDAESRLVRVARGYFEKLVDGPELRVVPLPEENAVCVVHAVRGGGKIFVASDESVLFVGSALDLDRGLEAFRAGERTPPTKFSRTT